MRGICVVKCDIGEKINGLLLLGIGGKPYLVINNNIESNRQEKIIREQVSYIKLTKPNESYIF